MDLRQRFLDWYLAGWRERVAAWHGGKLALYWLATVLLSFVGMYLMYAIGGGRMEVADFLLGWLAFVAVFCLGGPLPATWVWLSVREESGRADD